MKSSERSADQVMTKSQVPNPVVLQQTLLKTLQTLSNSAKVTRIWLALSGGVDSVALLHALVHTREQWPAALRGTPVLALHVHHGLSSNADDWVKECEQICQQYGVELVTERVQLSPQGSLEQQARQARYAVFEQYVDEGDALLMAHHHNDQLETFFLRLLRGSGLQGLASMSDQRTLGKGRLLRPWLTHSRKEIEDYRDHYQLAHVEDESNQDLSIDRNWWRLAGLPMIAQRFSAFFPSLSVSIAQLQEDKQVLDTLLHERLLVITTRLDWVKRVALSVDRLSDCDPALRRACIRTWLQQLGVYPVLAKAQLDVIWEEVACAQQDGSPHFLWAGHVIARHRACLVYVPLAEWAATESSPKTNWSGQAHNTDSLALMVEPQAEDTVGLKPGTYHLGHYENQLKVKLSGRPTKTLKKLFQEAHIPVWLRKQWPVILDGDVVVAIPGFGVNGDYMVKAGWALNLDLNKK